MTTGPELEKILRGILYPEDKKVNIITENVNKSQ